MKGYEENKDLDVGYIPGMPSQKHWEKDIGESVFPEGYDDHPDGVFLAKKGKNRPTPHIKINECDH